MRVKAVVVGKEMIISTSKHVRSYVHGCKYYD